MTFSLFRYLLLVATVTVLGCQKDTSIRWKEDVLLNDGRVVTLDRYQEFKGPHEIGQPPTESDYWFELTHPDTGERVRWNGDRIHRTVALFSRDKTLFLLTALDFDGWDRLDCPDPGFLLWRWHDSKWERIPLERIPVRRFNAGMTAYAGSLRRSGLLDEPNPHLSVGTTQHIQRQLKRWTISFESVEKQTFGPQNCAVSAGLFHDKYQVN